MSLLCQLVSAASPGSFIISAFFFPGGRIARELFKVEEPIDGEDAAFSAVSLP